MKSSRLTEILLLIINMMKVKLGGRALKIKNCVSLGSIKGLMFDSSSDGALIYGNSIWTPFVKGDLLLVFLDENMKVVRSKIAVPLTLNPKTWKIYECAGAKYCLELKDTNLRIKKGMKIMLGL